MSTLSFNISEQLREFIDARVRSGEYESEGEFLRDLVRREKQALDKLLLDGVDSGDPAPLDMADVKAKAKARLARE